MIVASFYQFIISLLVNFQLPRGFAETRSFETFRQFRGHLEEAEAEDLRAVESPQDHRQHRVEIRPR